MVVKMFSARRAVRGNSETSFNKNYVADVVPLIFAVSPPRFGIRWPVITFPESERDLPGESSEEDVRTVPFERQRNLVPAQPYQEVAAPVSFLFLSVRQGATRRSPGEKRLLPVHGSDDSSERFRHFFARTFGRMNILIYICTRKTEMRQSRSRSIPQNIPQ